MIDIRKLFLKVQEYDTDVYLADYTKQTESTIGVTISDAPFTDINYFHLHNAIGLPLWVINFEENTTFIPKGISNCECLFRVRNVEKGWWLLCELKYCLEKNIDTQSDIAYHQLQETWQLLVERRVINQRHSKVYWNISIPDHSNRAPFISFYSTQNEQIRWRKQHHVYLLGHNDVLVINEGILNVPSVRI